VNNGRQMHYHACIRHVRKYTIRLSGESQAADVLLEVTLLLVKLNVSTVIYQFTVLLELNVLVPAEIGETPFLGNNDLLSPRELVLSSSQGLDDDGFVGILASDREDDLTNVNPGDRSVRLSPSSTHTSLEPISSSTGQHLVDSNYVVRVNSDAHVESIFAGGLGNVFVGADTSGFEGLGR